MEPPVRPKRRISADDGTSHDLERRLRRMTRRGFALGGAAAVAGFAGWSWLVTRSEEDGLSWPFRRVLEFNERVARGLSRSSRLSPEFSRTAARMPRVNGSIGLESALDRSEWRLRVTGPAGGAAPRSFKLDEIKALPRVEMTTELRLGVEGSSRGRALGNAPAGRPRLGRPGLATAAGPGGPGDPADLLDYASARDATTAITFVGLDMASALHPQTLLCYEMDGQPLTPEHGAPLRLVIPVKYGIKNLKRIGTLRFTDERPADYWAQRGYDWYAGH